MSTPAERLDITAIVGDLDIACTCALHGTKKQPIDEAAAWIAWGDTHCDGKRSYALLCEPCLQVYKTSTKPLRCAACGATWSSPSDYIRQIERINKPPTPNRGSGQ